MPPDLAQKPVLSEAEGGVKRVAAMWHHLPEPVQDGILAMVKATTATPRRLE